MHTFSLGLEIQTSRQQGQDDGVSTEADSIKNVTRTKAYKRGYGSLARGRGPRDWVRDDRRKSAMENIRSIVARINKNSLFNKTRSASDGRGNGLYNEAALDELKMFEAKYEASLKNFGGHNQQSVDADEYDDGMDLGADVVEELDDGKGRSSSTLPHNIDTWESSHVNHVEDEKQDVVEDEKRDVVEEADNDASDLYEETLPDPKNSRVESHSQRAEGQPARKLIPESRPKKKPPKNRKVSGNCISFHMNNQ